MPTTLILIRHGLTDYSQQSRLCGFTDVPLNKKGIAQAKLLSRRLHNIGACPERSRRIDAIYTSDSLRSFQTAEIIFKTSGTKIRQTPALREMNFGAWEGLAHKQLQAKFRDSYNRWLKEPEKVRPPLGENLLELSKRVKGFVQKVLKENKGKVIAIVGHGGPNRVILCDALGLGLSKIWRIRQDPAAISVIEYYRSAPCVCAMNI